MTLCTQDALALIGHQFPGGEYRIAHWENWLLTDCTESPALPDGLVHPIALFHVPILGSRTSIAELFRLFHAVGPGTVKLVGYDWEYFEPLREDINYRCQGSIIEVERHHFSENEWSDTMAFQIDLYGDDAQPVARVTNRWRFFGKVS